MHTARHAITRARREAVITLGLERITQRLRSIATRSTTTAEALAVLRSYCHRAGIPTIAADDEALRYIGTVQAMEADIEILEDWLRDHAAVKVAAAACIARMRTGPCLLN